MRGVLALELLERGEGVVVGCAEDEESAGEGGGGESAEEGVEEGAAFVVLETTDKEEEWGVDVAGVEEVGEGVDEEGFGALFRVRKGDGFESGAANKGGGGGGFARPEGRVVGKVGSDAREGEVVGEEDRREKRVLG